MGQITTSYVHAFDIFEPNIDLFFFKDNHYEKIIAMSPSLVYALSKTLVLQSGTEMK